MGADLGFVLMGKHSLSTEFRAQLPEWMKAQGGKEGVVADTLKHGTRTISAQLSRV